MDFTPFLSTLFGFSGQGFPIVVVDEKSPNQPRAAVCPFGKGGSDGSIEAERGICASGKDSES
jgi:hypothetical protein